MDVLSHLKVCKQEREKECRRVCVVVMDKERLCVLSQRGRERKRLFERESFMCLFLDALRY